ncbi:MAG: hypothetical protein SAK29_04495 [Scytonema sp. PMC 1069.18]|nr:hypothetical protein [Scytonema sp. PMC 1069.18]
MTRFIHDQFAKDYLEELLKSYGEVIAPSRVAGEVREIDVLFVPSAQTTNIETLGLLGKLAARPAIFEPFRNPASVEEICDCLLKSLEVRGQLQREAKRNKTTLLKTKIPKLCVLTPTASPRLLRGFGAQQGVDWVSGVYLMAEYLRTAIVVIHQLPPIPETLWLRILGRGSVQNQAIDELVALAPSHPNRQATLELLYTLKQNLVTTQNSQPQEDDRALVMRLAPLYQQDRELARQEGRAEGVHQERRLVVENLLRVRFGSIDTELSAIVEPLMALSPEEFTPLLLQRSRAELIAQFGHQS